MVFNIYIRPLSEMGDFNMLMYLALSEKPEAAGTVISHCQEAVIKWQRVNKLKLNPDKMQVILATQQTTNLAATSLMINGGGKCPCELGNKFECLFRPNASGETSGNYGQVRILPSVLGPDIFLLPCRKQVRLC